MSTITWTCVLKPSYNSLDSTVYESKDGRWRLTKEFYAAGPSLFSWMLYGIDMADDDLLARHEFHTKKAATRYLESKGF